MNKIFYVHSSVWLWYTFLWWSIYLMVELHEQRVWVVTLVDNAKQFSEKLRSLKMGVLTYTPIRNCFVGKIGLTSPFFFSLLSIYLGSSPMPSIKSLRNILSGSFSSPPPQLQVTLQQSTPLLLKTEINLGCSLNLRNSKS